jgi:hypothetical protein
VAIGLRPPRFLALGRLGIGALIGPSVAYRRAPLFARMVAPENVEFILDPPLIGRLAISSHGSAAFEFLPGAASLHLGTLQGHLTVSSHGTAALTAQAGSGRVVITLVSPSNIPRPNLTHLKWCLLGSANSNQITPDQFTEIIDQGAIETTDLSGVLEIGFDNSAGRPSGSVLWLDITDSSGVPEETPRGNVFSGAVRIA